MLSISHPNVIETTRLCLYMNILVDWLEHGHRSSGSAGVVFNVYQDVQSIIEALRRLMHTLHF